MGPLLERLAPDVAYYGDGGGWGEAAFASPVYGRDRVAELLQAVVSGVAQRGISFRAAWVNGQPGMVVHDTEGYLILVTVFDILDGQVQAIRSVANPDKLRHIGPISRTWHPRWSKEHDS